MSAAVTAAVVAAITAIDARESLRAHSQSNASGTSAAPDALVSATAIISKSPQECYEFWRNPTNMTRISPMSSP